MSAAQISFCVVIPTADRPGLLQEAVASVLAQSVAAKEVIVVDNGLDPVPRSLLPAAEQLTLIRALPQMGVAQARNLGITLASATHIAFLDDDDRLDRDYLSAVRDCIDDSGAAVVLGNLRNGEDGTPLLEKHGPLPTDLERLLLTHNPGAGGSSTVVQRAAALKSSGYDPFLTTGQDKAFVLDLLRQGHEVVRAPDAWADINVNVQGERQTLIRKRVMGKRRFLAKYWSIMGWRERAVCLAQLLRLMLRRVGGRRL